MIPDLHDAHRSLEASAQRFGAIGVRAIFDQAFYGFATDLREQVHAVVSVTPGEFPRAAIANSRAALEASIDLSFLVSDEHEYEARAARALVWEWRELEESAHRAPPVTAGVFPIDFEATVIGNAKQFDAIAAGAGTLIRRAWETISKDVGAHRKHWSGLTREKLAEHVRGDGLSPDRVGIGLPALLGFLAAGSHPRPRVNLRDAKITPDGTLVISEKKDEVEIIKRAAALACCIGRSAFVARSQFGATMGA